MKGLTESFLLKTIIQKSCMKYQEFFMQYIITAEKKDNFLVVIKKVLGRPYKL